MQNQLFNDGFSGVREVKSSETYWMLLNVHYAKRIPSISHAFGLFENGELVGCVTYGTPSSSPLRSGVCGPEYSSMVVELNRLCLISNKKNQASTLVGRSLRMIPSPAVVVSFADKAQGHLGYVYQATNFTYCGLSAKRTDWAIKGSEGVHGQTIADQFRGMENRAELMRGKYGDDFYLKERSRKHRYVYFCGSKSWKKSAISNLRYPVESYPKEAT